MGKLWREGARGFLTGSLLFACYSLMSHYAAFVAIALVHDYWIPKASRKHHMVAVVSYILAFLILQPHNYYVVLFVFLIYAMGMGFRRVQAFHYQVLFCLVAGATLLTQLDLILMAAIHINRSLDGTYLSYLLAKN